MLLIKFQFWFSHSFPLFYSLLNFLYLWSIEKMPKDEIIWKVEEILIDFMYKNKGTLKDKKFKAKIITASKWNFFLFLWSKFENSFLQNSWISSKFMNFFIPWKVNLIKKQKPSGNEWKVEFKYYFSYIFRLIKKILWKLW